MIIRRCISCGEYRYLPEDGLCRSCMDRSDWGVVCKYGHMEKIKARRLTEEEAREKASEMGSYHNPIHLSSSDNK
jgi:hypothetical protein